MKNPHELPPIFIPLKREFYDAFERREKRHEYRRESPRFNAQTCQPGRPVILSCGYGRQRRMEGIIKAYSESHTPQDLPGWIACYGTAPATAAIIEIELIQRPRMSRLQAEAHWRREYKRSTGFDPLSGRISVRWFEEWSNDTLLHVSSMWNKMQDKVDSHVLQ